MLFRSWLNQWEYVGLGVLLVLLIYFAHRDNISRLISGTESRIGHKKSEA